MPTGVYPRKRNLKQLTCLSCNKTFSVIQSRVGRAKFCSDSCRLLEQGIKKGSSPWNKGKPHLRGEKHWNWRGGIDKEHTRIKQTKEYKEWRNAVYRRDRWTCRSCGAKKQIVAHHIEPFSLREDLRFVVDNGVTLCRACHQEVHKPRRKDFKLNPIAHA